MQLAEQACVAALLQLMEVEAAGVKVFLVINTVNGAVAGFREQLDIVARAEGERGGAYVPTMEAIEAAEWARMARHYGYA